MKYNIYKKKMGVNPSLLLSFETEQPIVEALTNSSKEMFLLTANDMFSIDFETKELNCILEGAFKKAVDFDYDSSTGYFYVVEDDCKAVYKIEDSTWSCRDIIEGSNQDLVEKLLKKHKTSPTSIAVYNGYGFYLCIKNINQILEFSNSSLKVIGGDGFARYSVGNSAESSSFNFPSDVAYENDKLYVADTGNHCIRCISDGSVSLVCGGPNGKHSPKKIVASDNAIYFVTENCVSSLSNVLFKSKKENANLLICINEDRDLFIVEDE